MNQTMIRSLIVLMATASLAACATPTPGADENARTSADRFKVKVESEPEEVRLALHAQGISEPQAKALKAFVDKWRDTSMRDVKIQTPSNARDPAAAYRMAESARTYLIAQGLSEDQVEVAGYDAGDDAAAPLIVGYLRYKAEIPECGKNWPNIAHSFSNKAQPNFACAVTANMAAQIADPADLVQPQTMTPPDAARRQAVLDNYRVGKKTTAERDAEMSGTVSDAVK